MKNFVDPKRISEDKVTKEQKVVLIAMISAD